MSIRTFQDADGRLWRGWATMPAKPELLVPEFAGGWLTFRSGGEKYRLALIPPSWETAPEDRLDLLRRAALPAE